MFNSFSPAIIRQIRSLSRLYKITSRGEKAEKSHSVRSIVFLAECAVNNKKDEDAFLKVLRREFDLYSQFQCGSVEYLDVLHDCISNEENDESDVFSRPIPALSKKVQRLLDAAAGGATTADMAVKMGLQRRAVQTQLTVLTERLGGFATVKQALPRSTPVNKAEVEAKRKANWLDKHPVTTWSAEQVAAIYDDATIASVTAALLKRELQKKAAVEQSRYAVCAEQIAEVEGVHA